MRIKSFTVILSAVLLLIPLANFGCGSGEGKIAYISLDDNIWALYLMNANGTNNTKLVENAYEACISPDGTRVVYGYREVDIENAQVVSGTYIIGSNGSNKTKISDQRGLHYSWSPDGSKIAFVDGGANGIYTINANGSDETELPLSRGFYWLTNPTWSPDSSKIAFYGFGYVKDGYEPSPHSPAINKWQQGVFTVAIDGSNQQFIAEAGLISDYLISTSQGDEYGVTGIAWAPDNSKIAFISKDESYVDVIYTANADGSDKAVVLTKEDVGEDVWVLEYLAFSPDGNRLLFAAHHQSDSQQESFERIYTINADGSNLTRIGDVEGDIHYPSWGR